MLKWFSDMLLIFCKQISIKAQCKAFVNVTLRKISTKNGMKYFFLIWQLLIYYRLHNYNLYSSCLLFFKQRITTKLFSQNQTTAPILITDELLSENDHGEPVFAASWRFDLASAWCNVIKSSAGNVWLPAISRP